MQSTARQVPKSRTTPIHPRFYGTKQRVVDDHRSSQQRAAAAERLKRKRDGLARAARMPNSQEVMVMPPAKQPVRAHEAEDEVRARAHMMVSTASHLFPRRARRTQTFSRDCGLRRAAASPEASGYAYRSRRRSAAAAEEAHEEEEDGWADEARGIFREHEGRRALVDGNVRSCGQDGLVTVATTLGVHRSCTRSSRARSSRPLPRSR